MGVQALWTLINPVARPIHLDTMANKTLAIDSSIWLYQFQKAMRDQQGKTILNAHILGFLRRISKLLYYGIKPIFVFDGGVPTLKKQTINERTKRKRGGQENLAKTAEKLLAAQLRQAALRQTQKQQLHQTGDVITNKTVYFEDSTTEDFLEKNRKKPRVDSSEKPRTKSPDKPSSSARYVPKDQYQLPPIEVPAFSATETDHRLATETELKEFIHQFTPEDLDINSAEFQALSTELKYEIIGDLRIKSRQPNQIRAEAMRNTNDLDFSHTQILNLKKRNDLTQKLLTVTDMVAKANLTIPVKIAAQRNKEYVLEKAPEGWILAIGNEKTSAASSAQKPSTIDLDPSSSDAEAAGIEGAHQPLTLTNELADSDDEIEFEEVAVIQPPDGAADVRRRREEDLRNAISFHYGTKDQDCSLGAAAEIGREDGPEDLFCPSAHQDADDDELLRDIIAEVVAHEASHLPPNERPDLGEGTSHSRPIADAQPPLDEGSSLLASSDKLPSQTVDHLLGSIQLELDDGFLLASPPPPPTSIEAMLAPPLASNALALADQSLHKDPAAQDTRLPVSVSSPKLLQQSQQQPQQQLPQVHDQLPSQLKQKLEQQPQPQQPQPQPQQPQQQPQQQQHARYEVEYIVDENNRDGKRTSSGLEDQVTTITPTVEDQDRQIKQTSMLGDEFGIGGTSVDPVPRLPDPVDHSSASGPGRVEAEDQAPRFPDSRELPATRVAEVEETVEEDGGSEEDEWSRVIEAEEQALDADLAEESEEWSRFLSGLGAQTSRSALQAEADEEVGRLQAQHAKARRDADEVTQQMSREIQTLLRLFGIPYVESPMEAEAQCAALEKLALVDGIITEDSDVFLFGGQTVYKNIFNQNKFVECYRAADLRHELGLGQHKLIQLAFLLGSDYTPGLPGVGPVSAMEILADFDLAASPTPDAQRPDLAGLVHFKQWWVKVQVGKDTDPDSTTPFRKKFRKKKDKIWIDESWPNPAVAEAYLHPTVDHSSERFVWGLPDLDGLREFLYDHLSWSSLKTDEVIVPLIKRQTQRTQGGLPSQGILSDYFDYSVESGGRARGIQSAFASQRLQKVVRSWREKKRLSGPAEASEASPPEGSVPAPTKPPKRPRQPRKRPAGAANPAPRPKPMASSAPVTRTSSRALRPRPAAHNPPPPDAPAPASSDDGSAFSPPPGSPDDLLDG